MPTAWHGAPGNPISREDLQLNVQASGSLAAREPWPLKRVRQRIALYTAQSRATVDSTGEGDWCGAGLQRL